MHARLEEGDVWVVLYAAHTGAPDQEHDERGHTDLTSACMLAWEDGTSWAGACTAHMPGMAWNMWAVRALALALV